MSEERYILHVNPEDTLSLVDRKLVEEEIAMSKAPHMSNKELAQIKSNIKSQFQDYEHNVSTGSKRKVVKSFEDGPSKKYLTDMQILSEMAGRKLNVCAKEIVLRMLENGESQMKHCKLDEICTPISTANLSGKINFENIPDSVSSSSTWLSDYLQLMAAEENPFVRKYEEKGSGQYTVHLKNIVAHLKQELIESYITEKFGIVGCRIWRLLLTKGKLGEKEIAKLAMVSNKTAREITYALMQSQMIFLQDVPKTVDHAPSRTFFLWFVSMPRCIDALVQESYDIWAKLKLRKEKELKDMAPLLEKVQRTDVKEDEDLLTDAEKEGLNHLKTLSEKLRVSEARLDRALMILRDF
ncbi:DNA-directed RNA polymerase III subunit RPC3 [Chytridiales sp. JEL 0842]|nr:DNA-directed RNA polymerase III subunit RPC3 [Chytridiales sp. JEL 0842]